MTVFLSFEIRFCRMVSDRLKFVDWTLLWVVVSDLLCLFWSQIWATALVVPLLIHLQIREQNRRILKPLAAFWLGILLVLPMVEGTLKKNTHFFDLEDFSQSGCSAVLSYGKV